MLYKLYLRFKFRSLGGSKARFWEKFSGLRASDCCNIKKIKIISFFYLDVVSGLLYFVELGFEGGDLRLQDVGLRFDLCDGAAHDHVDLRQVFQLRRDLGARQRITTRALRSRELFAPNLRYQLPRGFSNIIFSKETSQKRYTVCPL